jgi:superfamily II DNA/RNA helicase
MAYIIKRTGAKPTRNRDFGSKFKPKTGFKKNFSRNSSEDRAEKTGERKSFGNKRFSGKRIDTRPGADRSDFNNERGERSERSDRPRFSGARTGGRPSAGRSRFGDNKFGPKRSFSGGRSGGRSGGNRRGPKGENIDVNRFISKAESSQVPEEIVSITHKFADFAFDAKLKEAIEQKGFVNPTPIQDQAIPFILKGRDVVGLANTGTGKTGAFLLPLITKARLISDEKVLILAPTRELAIQIADELKSFTANDNMYFTCCVGGAHIGKQMDQLRRKNNFIIGTPGRVKDLIQRKMIDTSQFNTIVLDEADRMLDMGFIEDMKWILSGFPKERQTLFFSATLSPQIEKLIHEFLKNPEFVSVRKRETSKNIDQDVVRVSNSEEKVQILCKLLKDENCEKVIVFGKTKRGVETLSKNLFRSGFKAESIHGDKSHSQRQRALRAFKEGKANILVATDVAARGLDIPNVTHVINYDTPQTYDDYVHRIGRTGRGDATGKAYTFVEHRK